MGYILVRDMYEESYIYGIVVVEKADEKTRAKIVDIVHKVKKDNPDEYSTEDLKNAFADNGYLFVEDILDVNF